MSSNSSVTNSRESENTPLSPAWIRRAEQRQAAEQRRRKRAEAEQMKHKDGTTASIPRVPSGALEGIQPKLLREACLAKEKPPLLIMRVLGAMCLLLEENPTWLVARQLIVDSETNMTMAGEDADTASKMSLIERLRNLNISRISEKTLHRLRRVVEHAGPNFSPEHLRSLE